MQPVLTLLYVPADRPDRIRKALASGADGVVMDLEDAVAPDGKERARQHVAELLAGLDPSSQLQVRVNASGTPWHDDDLAMVAGLNPEVGLRLPKSESVEQVQAVGKSAGPRALHLLIESALGVERAYQLACVPHTASLGLGEADLRSELGISSETGLAWIRSRVVVAARAAGLPAPLMSVFPHIKDLEALRLSSMRGRELGFLGRSAIHPAQLPVIVEAFRPTLDEYERAVEVLQCIRSAIRGGSGGIQLADGSFLDRAMIDESERIVSLYTR